MNNRLLEVIKYKTGGRQNKFAALMGWTPPYLAKLLRGDNFGLQPVLTILEKVPEIDARWFLLGVGRMLSEDKLNGLRRAAYSSAQRLMDYERYMLVMTADELKEFEDSIVAGRMPEFTDEDIMMFELRLRGRDKKVADAIDKSISPCKP